jgi:hypothetical protein
MIVLSPRSLGNNLDSIWWALRSNFKLICVRISIVYGKIFRLEILCSKLPTARHCLYVEKLCPVPFPQLKAPFSTSRSGGHLWFGHRGYVASRFK